MKFKSLPVFTTRAVFNKEKQVNLVIHDLDGDWQFLNIDELLDESNALIISMEEAIAIEVSIKSVLSFLKVGTCAVLNENNEWIISQIYDSNT